MKKLKEFLLLIALMAFTVLPVVIFMFWPERYPNLPAFADRWHYFKMMISDSIFLSALGRTVAWMLALCGLTAMAGGIMLWRLRKRFFLYRGLVYVAAFFLFLVVTLLCSVAQAWTLGSNLAWILPLQCSALALLLVWLVELVVGAIRKKEARKRTGNERPAAHCVAPSKNSTKHA